MVGRSASLLLMGVCWGVFSAAGLEVSEYAPFLLKIDGCSLKPEFQPSSEPPQRGYSCQLARGFADDLLHVKIIENDENVKEISVKKGPKKCEIDPLKKHYWNCLQLHDQDDTLEISIVPNDAGADTLVYKVYIEKEEILDDANGGDDGASPSDKECETCEPCDTCETCDICEPCETYECPQCPEEQEPVFTVDDSLALFDLEISYKFDDEYKEGTLFPSFNPDIVNYELQVEKGVRQFRIYAHPMGRKSGSTVLVPAHPSDSGKDGGKEVEMFGDSELTEVAISILVMNTNGEFQPYTIVVRRPPCDDCDEQQPSPFYEQQGQGRVDEDGGGGGRSSSSGYPHDDGDEGQQGQGEFNQRRGGKTSTFQNKGENNFDSREELPGNELPFDDNFLWVPEDWSDCNEYKIRTRQVSCVHIEQQILQNDELCEHLPKPAEEESCDRPEDYYGRQAEQGMPPGGMPSTNFQNQEPLEEPKDVDDFNNMLGDNNPFNHQDDDDSPSDNKQDFYDSDNILQDDGSDGDDGTPDGWMNQINNVQDHGIHQNIAWDFMEHGWGPCIDGSEFNKPVCFIEGIPCDDPANPECFDTCDKREKPDPIDRACIDEAGHGHIPQNDAIIQPPPHLNESMNISYWILFGFALVVSVGTCVFLRWKTGCDLHLRILDSLSFLRRFTDEQKSDGLGRHLTSSSSSNGDEEMTEAGEFVSDILKRLGFPEVSIPPFTEKLRSDFITTVDQLRNLDDSEWRMLAYPETIETELRKELKRPQGTSSTVSGGGNSRRAGSGRLNLRSSPGTDNGANDGRKKPLQKNIKDNHLSQETKRSSKKSSTVQHQNETDDWGIDVDDNDDGSSSEGFEDFD